MRTEDGHLIQKCLDGEPAAFGFLVDKYKSCIYAFAYSKLGNYHDAEDIAQEAFFKAYQKLHALRGYDKFLAWLYAITNNLCKDFLRAKASRPDGEFVEEIEEEVLERPSMDAYQAGLTYESLYDALKELPEMYRQVLTLHYLGGMKSREIAEFLGTSKNTIDQRLNRAKSLLKEEMLAMMSTTYNEMKLQPSFTFRIVEMIKETKIQTPPNQTALPWGLSVTAGLVAVLLSLAVPISPLYPIGALIGSVLSAKTQVAEKGEIPVDVVDITKTPILSSEKGKKDFGQKPKPKMNAFAPPGQDGKWMKRADMPTERSDLATVVVNGKIYAIGGRRWGEYVRTVEEYDPVADKWVKKGDMPFPRAWATANIVNGKIYVIGGFNAVTLARVDEYDPLTDTWTRKADMPTARWYFSTSVVNGKIYVIGGQPQAQGLLATVEEYDPVADKWTKKADMPTAKAGLSTSVVNGKIYAIGGNIGIELATVEEYDPVTDKWTKKADMPTARMVLSTSAVNGRIYAIGGFAPWPDGSVAVEEYDPVADKWTKKAALPVPRVGLSTTVVNGKIYAIGGGPSQFVPWSTTVLEYDPEFAGEAKGVEAKGKLPTLWGKLKTKD